MSGPRRRAHRPQRGVWPTRRQYPDVTGQGEPRFVTLGQLRAMVDAADDAGLDDDLIVRGNMIPFRVADLGHRIGGALQFIGLDDRPNH